MNGTFGGLGDGGSVGLCSARARSVQVCVYHVHRICSLSYCLFLFFLCVYVQCSVVQKRRVIDQLL